MTKTELGLGCLVLRNYGKNPLHQTSNRGPGVNGPTQSNTEIYREKGELTKLGDTTTVTRFLSHPVKCGSRLHTASWVTDVVSFGNPLLVTVIDRVRLLDS